MLIIFSSSSSLADNKKITVEEVESFFEYKFKERLTQRELFSPYTKENIKRLEEKRKEKRKERKEIKEAIGYQKRLEARLIAKCLYNPSMSKVIYRSMNGERTDCQAKVTRTVLTYSDKSKKKRPGDIFYVLHLIDSMNNPLSYWNWNLFINFHEYTEYEKKPKNFPGLKCKGGWFYKMKEVFSCISYNKTFYKKFQKFKKNPSKENLLGLKRVRYLKRLRMIKEIKEKLGFPLNHYDLNYYDTSYSMDITNDVRIAYPLIGDMLNNVVVEVKKNKVSPELAKRRALLKKYSLILQKIKKNLNEDNYKSIDKDRLKIINTFKNLQELERINNKIAIKVDKTVNAISEINKSLETSILNVKKSEEDKLVANTLIILMETYVELILYEIPEKYRAITKPLDKNLFHEIEIKALGDIVENMVRKNKQIKSDELAQSIDVINKKLVFLNIDNVVKKLENLGISNYSSKPFTQDYVNKIAADHIINNLDKDILKEAKKALQKIDRNTLAGLEKELSNITSEIASSSSVQDTVSTSVLDKKFGEVTLKQLIGAARR